MRLLPFSTKSKGATLHYPLRPLPRIAVFDERFASGGTVFSCDWWESSELADRSIQTAAASPERLIRLIALDWCPTYPLVALTAPGNFLTEYDRDLLWRAFEVPVFEQVLDSKGNLLASECDAHDGLHLQPGTDVRWPEMIRVEGLCGCGKPGSRILSAPRPKALRATA